MKQQIIKSMARSATLFVRDYADRHKDPVNAALHLVGVPAVFYGLFQIAAGRSVKLRSIGVICFVLGYVLQYLGHKRQGNEVGEVSLIKFLLAKVKEASFKRMRSYNWSNTADDDDSREGEAVGVGGKKRNGHSNGHGNGHNGHGNGHGRGEGRYILWWKTSH